MLARHGDNLEIGIIQPEGTFKIMGLQPSKSYIFSVESTLIERTLPSEKAVMITKDDTFDVDFVSIERPGKFSVSGAAFFEGEENPKQYKSLYKEKPLLTIDLHEVGNGQPLKSMQLPMSHIFEFKGLTRGKSYELVVKSSKPIVDRRHESTTTITVRDNEETGFTKVVIPFKGK